MIDEEFNVPPQNQFALPFSSPLPCLNMQAAQAAQAARRPDPAQRQEVVNSPH